MKDKNNPNISVILPVYNMDLYLHAAIDSILAQTFENFELIIIDDASTDNTLEIIGSYSDDRIICLQNERNIGNYPSRNKGLSVARGKYIAIMDGDDISLPNRLNCQYQYMEQHPEVVATGTEFRFIPNAPKEDIPATHEAIILSFLKGYYAILHPSLMIKTQMIQYIQGYNEEYRYASDYDLIARLSFIGKIVNLTEILMNYRKHALQISQNDHSEQIIYAEKIRENYQLNFINFYKSSDQSLVNQRHVSHFQMGAAIAYYTYARRIHSETYEAFADYLLEQVLNAVATDLPVCLHNGICGIGYGLIYLLRNHFVEGNEDEVLKEIDHAVLTCLQTDEELNGHRQRLQDCMDYMQYRKYTHK
jgi:glycosyltransferase involved in cell wall biosynthesis